MGFGVLPGRMAEGTGSHNGERERDTKPWSVYE